MIIEAIKDMSSYETLKIAVPNEDICPICKSGLMLTPIESIVFPRSNDNLYFLYTFCYCTVCKNVYINTYDYKLGYTAQKLLSEPNRFKKTDFGEDIERLSPSFVEIYNQAKEAESLNLDQIAGIGYRKATEFLIKDFTIHEHPEEEDTIKSAALSTVINNYIDDRKIKKLAEVTVWIGNDETHYIRKHTERDISDLKRFINACVHYINMDLIYQDSQTVERK